MLIGKCAFDAEDMDELVSKIEEGKYKVPTSLSTEVVSFLNGMLQYESKQRLSCEELYNHQFLRNNVKDFHKLDLTQVSNKVKNGELVMETKKDKNRTIWSVFNENEKLLKISPGHLAPIPENTAQNEIKKQKTLDQVNNYNNNYNNPQAIKNLNTFQMYSHPNMNNYNNYNPTYDHPYFGPILPRGNQGIPGNPPTYQNNISQPFPPNSYNQPMSETNYVCRGGIYG